MGDYHESMTRVWEGSSLADRPDVFRAPRSARSILRDGCSDIPSDIRFAERNKISLAHILLATRRHPGHEATSDDTGRHFERNLVRGASNLRSGGREAVGVRVSPLAPR